MVFTELQKKVRTPGILTPDFLQCLIMLVLKVVCLGKWFVSLLFVFFGLCHRACGILVPQPGIEPVLPVVETRNLSTWTAGVVSWEMF